MNDMSKMIIYTDGGARGNPGPAGIGVVILNDSNDIVREYCEYIGQATNNQAEYLAVVKAFDLIRACEIENNVSVESLEFFLDSELVVKQLNGEYRVKNKDLGALFVKIHNARAGYENVTFEHIPREKNKEADLLVNKAIDDALNRHKKPCLI